MRNTHRGVLLLGKLQAKVVFFKLYKWNEIAQNVANVPIIYKPVNQWFLHGGNIVHLWVKTPT